MDTGKALLSRRSYSNRDRYFSIVSGEDEESGVELHNTSQNSENRSSGSDADGSVFLDDSQTRANNENQHYRRNDVKVLDGKHVQFSRPASSGDRKSKRSRSLGHDSVDMSIKSSKDVAKGFKRRASENRDIVYDFGWFDIIIGIGSIIVYFVDVVTDIKLAVDYFLDTQWFYGGVTTALIIGPSLVTCCFGLHWYIIDYRMEKTVIKKCRKKNKSLNHVTPSHVWFFRFFFTILQIGPVVRTFEYLYYGCRSRSKKIDDKARRRFHWWMLYEDVDNCLLRLFESFLESAPQLTWQLYITITEKPDDNSAIGTTTRSIALLSSWGSLAVSLVSYHRSLRNSREDKYKMQFFSIPFYFLWRASETGGRVLCIAMFATAFKFWVFGILLFHWVVISGWLMNQRTTFYAQRCLEKVFNVICGYVMLFCFLNLREGNTRYRFLIFYIIFYIENFFMLAFWFRFTPDLGAWFHIWGFIVVLIFFVLHIIFQLLYYSCCHPTHSIEWCLPCDKYTFYESVCYDVRPEIDDGIGSPSKRYTSQEMVVEPEVAVPQLVVTGIMSEKGDAGNFHEMSLAENNDWEKRLDRGASHQGRRYKQHSNGRQKHQRETDI